MPSTRLFPHVEKWSPLVAQLSPPPIAHGGSIHHRVPAGAGIDRGPVRAGERTGAVLAGNIPAHATIIRDHDGPRILDHRYAVHRVQERTVPDDPSTLQWGDELPVLCVIGQADQAEEEVEQLAMHAGGFRSAKKGCSG